MSEDGVRVVEKRRVPGEGLRMLLEQTVAFPKGVKMYNPETGTFERRMSVDVLFDASIPEVRYRAYESFALGKDSRERILILLAVLGYSYPTTAIANATDVALSTTKRLLWELKRDGYLEGAYSGGSFVDSEIWPYRYGHLRENYYMLTDRGVDKAAELMEIRVVPLAPPVGAVEVEMREHPWLTREQAVKVASEHEETMKRARELREKISRGEKLTVEERVFMYGSEAEVLEKPILRVEERPWEKAARIAEETRKRMEEAGR